MAEQSFPVDTVCADYFSHLSPKNLKQNIAHGKIDLPLVQIDNSRQAARGVHVRDLGCLPLDKQHQFAVSDHEKLGSQLRIEKAIAFYYSLNPLPSLVFIPRRHSSAYICALSSSLYGPTQTLLLVYPSPFQKAL